VVHDIAAGERSIESVIVKDAANDESDIRLDLSDPPMEPGGQIVENHDLGPDCQKGAYEVVPDEAGTARDQCLHR
jgi:hypothetical protein